MTNAVFANWVRNTPAFMMDSAMQGLTCGGALYFAQNAGLYSLLPRLIMLTSPVTLALTVASAALAKHTTYFILAKRTGGKTDTKQRHPEGGMVLRHTLGTSELRKKIADRAILVGEMALISLMLGGGISALGIVSIYFAKALAERLSNFFFVDTLHRQANEDVQNSWVQNKAQVLAKKISSYHPWGEGHRLGNN